MGQSMVQRTLTELHHCGQVCGTKFDHDRICITIDDLCIMGMSVGDTVFSFHFLDDG